MSPATIVHRKSANAGSLTAEARWQLDRVIGATSASSTRLSHVLERAELNVISGRLHRGVGYQHASRQTRRDLARTGAILRLRERGRYYVHAAGVVDPLGRAWLLVGETGSGKSTLCYALARQGWAILGDDGVVVEPRGRAREALLHGWRDDLLVSLDQQTRFAELGSRLQHVLPNDRRRRVPVRVTFARRATLIALAIVSRSGKDAITPLSKTAALAAIVAQSPWVLLPDPLSRAHLQALGRVVADSRVFALDNGPGQPDRVAHTLMAALA